MTGHSSVMPINGVIGDKTLIDYLSFTWAPDELRRMTDLAKQGALLKAIPRFDTQVLGIKAAFAAPAVADLRYLWKRPASFAPLSRFEQETQRLRDKVYPKPEARPVAPVLTPSMTQMMEAALHSDYKSRADMRKELKAVCSALLDFSEFEVVPDAKYWHAYNDIIDSYGVQFLDALCCAEIDLWLEELNHQIGVPISPPLFS
ncbi:hypothetical protein, partial [Aeromonas eucrenophila]|uniref:Uncharacterized protein n=1 Tax=Aeromonas eucrenophila TaxID=649 RepID=A0ABW0YF73_9GAMM